MESTTKSFWQRPEGKFGMLLLAALVILGFWGMGIILPFILMAIQNALYATLLGVGLLILWVVITDDRMQLNAKAAFQIFSKTITGLIIPVDPIAIIEAYLKDLEKNLAVGEKQLDLLAGQESKLIKKIEDNKKLIEGYNKAGSFAKQKLAEIDKTDSRYQDIYNSAALNGNKAARLEASNKKYNDVLNKITNLRKILEKMNKNAHFVFEDMTDDIANQKIEYASINAGYSAFKKVKSVLAGDKDQQILKDEALEYMATRMGNQVGELERFMSNSAGMLTSMDLNNEATLERGMQMISEWESKGDTLFITSPKNDVRELAPVTVINTNKTAKGKYL